jgi:hypothetical protein
MPNFAGATRNRGDRYKGEHQKERARLKPTVEAGLAYCQQGIRGNGSSGHCYYRSRWIPPGTPWVLGHNDAGTAYIGPCHAKCNQRDGARRGGIAVHRRRRRARAATPSRNW